MSVSSGAGHGQGELAVNDSAYTQRWDAQIAKLALASILIDTANLTAPGKVEEVDRQAVRYLEAKIGLSAKDVKSWDRAAFYSDIVAAKSEIEHLTVNEMLIKDYKEWTENGQKLGISSVVKPLTLLAQKSAEKEDSPSHALEQILDDFMTEHDLSVFAIMTAFKSEKQGDFQRELLLQAIEPAFSIADHFSTSATSELGLEETLDIGLARHVQPSHGQFWRNYYIQRDVTKSRKQVAPMLRAALKG